jgi:parvulin-like peptidyl-prolyl isomerase
VEDFLFGAEPGERSEPIETPFGWYVAELLGKEDARELDSTQRDVVVTRMMNEWLDGLEVPVEGGELSDSDLEHAFDSLDA